jgi:hypothetical protein
MATSDELKLMAGSARRAAQEKRQEADQTRRTITELEQRFKDVQQEQRDIQQQLGELRQTADAQEAEAREFLLQAASLDQQAISS